MSQRFISLLSRVTRVRSQIEQEVRRTQPNVLRLIRMKRLQLLLKAQLLDFTTVRFGAAHAGLRLVPVPVRGTVRQRHAQPRWA